MLKLKEVSGFPEPYFSNSIKILRIWRNGRNEKIVREDLRDLSRLPELSRVEMLTSILPTKIGSPLSVQSLREDLEVAHDTVTRWLKYLNELYYFFEVRPWSKSIPRSLKKEGKIYLYDWTDTGEGDFDLYYLRNKEKQEIDFIIIKDKKPWLCIESKLNDFKIDHKAVDKFTSFVQCPFVQVVMSPGIWKLDGQKLVASAARVFSGLP